MSTQFRTADTDEFIGTRWCSRRSPSNIGFDWGADVSRALRFTDEQPDVLDEEDHRYSWPQFTAEVLDLALWTFGEFGGTFELGSGDLATWEGA